MLTVGAAAGCSSNAKPTSQPGGCPAPAIHQANTSPSLPTLFPTPRGITYGPMTVLGPATVIHAYSSSSARVTFDLYRRDLGSDPYQVTSSHFDTVSGEILFRGKTVSGTVELTSGCRGVGSVDITLRSATSSSQ